MYVRITIAKVKEHIPLDFSFIRNVFINVNLCEKCIILWWHIFRFYAKRDNAFSTLIFEKNGQISMEIFITSTLLQYALWS